MKRFAVVILFVLTLPLAAFAHINCPGGSCRPYGNTGGALVGTDSGLSLNSVLTNFHGIMGADLGTVTITTGPLLSGSLQTGGTFSNVGSSYTLAFNGRGTLFTGTFNSPITWSPVSGDPGSYVLQGTFNGYWANYGGWGTVTETYHGSFNSNGVFKSTAGGGLAMINPEPGTLGLVATGLAAMAGTIRRKLRL